VMGAGPNGEALPPAEVMPTPIYEQMQIPSGSEAPATGMPPPPGMPPTQDRAPAPAGGYWRKELSSRNRRVLGVSAIICERNLAASHIGEKWGGA